MTNLLLLSRPNLQSSTLAHYLETKLSHPLTTIDTINSIEFSDSDSYIVLVDLSVSHDLIDLSHRLKKHRKNIRTVLINTAENIPLEELVIWPNLFGMFKHSDDINTVCKGLATILNGENWLSRKVLNQLLDYYRTHITSEVITRSVQPEIELTRRESEILQTLKSGASNIEIADKLFISEHTIKSHLYNIFKKLEVKNRLQAMSWAKQNLD